AFGIALIPLLSAPLLPTIDFYNHISRFYVLSHIDGSPFLRSQYRANWSLLPNIGLDVIGTGLMRLLPPLAAAKAIAVLMFATQYFGVLFFNRQLVGRVSPITALLMVPLLYSFIFTWGFANFLFGLGLAFWGAGGWLALRRRPLMATAVGCAIATVVFLAHG